MAVVVDENKIKSQSDSLIASLEYYNKYAKPVVEEYTGELDEKVFAINNYINKCHQMNIDFDINSLDRIVTELSATIYFVSDKYEQLSMIADMANVRYKDKFNSAYLAKQAGAKQEDRKYTAEQLRAIANQDALEEELVKFMYEHAAAVVKSKLDSAQEVLKACSKVLSSKIETFKRFGGAN